MVSYCFMLCLIRGIPLGLQGFNEFWRRVGVTFIMIFIAQFIQSPLCENIMVSWIFPICSHHTNVFMTAVLVWPKCIQSTHTSLKQLFSQMIMTSMVGWLVGACVCVCFNENSTETLSSYEINLWPRTWISKIINRQGKALRFETINVFQCEHFLNLHNGKIISNISITP